jgi:hypothetical protein
MANGKLLTSFLMAAEAMTEACLFERRIGGCGGGLGEAWGVDGKDGGKSSQSGAGQICSGYIGEVGRGEAIGGVMGHTIGGIGEREASDQTGSSGISTGVYGGDVCSSSGEVGSPNKERCKGCGRGGIKPRRTFSSKKSPSMSNNTCSSRNSSNS